MFYMFPLDMGAQEDRSEAVVVPPRLIQAFLFTTLWGLIMYWRWLKGLAQDLLAQHRLEVLLAQRQP